MSCVRFFRPAKRFPTVSVHFFPSQMPFAQIVGRQIIPKFLWCLHALSPRKFSRGCQWSSVFSHFSRPLMKPLWLLPCSLGFCPPVACGNSEPGAASCLWVRQWRGGGSRVPMFCGEFKRVALSWLFYVLLPILQDIARTKVLYRFYKFYSFRKQSIPDLHWETCQFWDWWEIHRDHADILSHPLFISDLSYSYSCSHYFLTCLTCQVLVVCRVYRFLDNLPGWSASWRLHPVKGSGFRAACDWKRVETAGYPKTVQFQVVPSSSCWLLFSWR